MNSPTMNSPKMLRPKILCLLVLPLLALLAYATQEAGRNPFADDPQASEFGRVRFRESCAICHGIGGEGGRAPELTLGTYGIGNSDQELFQVISEGVPGSEMPGFAGNMSNETIWKLVTYLRSIARRESPAISGDAASGERIFWDQCGSCHRIRSKGGRLGPDLGRIGRSRGVPYIREAILSPDADVTRGYNTITVVTRDGRKFVGVERNIDDFSVQFMDTQETLRSFLRSEVRSVQREFRSLMPAYDQSLSAAEIDDLVAYLLKASREDVKQ